MNFHAEISSHRAVLRLKGLYRRGVVERAKQLNRSLRVLPNQSLQVAGRVFKKESLVQVRPESPRNREESRGLEKGLRQLSVKRLDLNLRATICPSQSRLVSSLEAKLKPKSLLHRVRRPAIRVIDLGQKRHRL